VRRLPFLVLVEQLSTNSVGRGGFRLPSKSSREVRSCYRQFIGVRIGASAQRKGKIGRLVLYWRMNASHGDSVDACPHHHSSDSDRTEYQTVTEQQ
jgi:hypothetical protein